MRSVAVIKHILITICVSGIVAAVSAFAALPLRPMATDSELSQRLKLRFTKLPTFCHSQTSRLGVRRTTNDMCESCVLYFDGAVRQNPHGPAGCGWVVFTYSGTTLTSILEGEGFLGFGVCNNQAEYLGLIKGLQGCLKEGIECDRLIIRGDSEVVIQQMIGAYKVRSDRIRPLHDAVHDLLDEMETYAGDIVFEHVNRPYNSQADSLANHAIDLFISRYHYQY
jgi:ribonuclease HI